MEQRDAMLDMLYLAGCGINEQIPHAERLAGMDLQAVHGMAKQQSLSALICMALESAGVEDDVMAAFAEEKNKAIRKNLLLNADRQKLLQFMETQGIRYLPLKGSLLQDDYPRAGMRQMSDNDILIDAEHRAAVRDWFAAQGYTVLRYGDAVHDNYQKPPVYSYEMHVRLFSPHRTPVLHDYYADVWARLVPMEGCQHGYRFTEEDFYLYLTAHSYKHYNEGGTGLRSLVDTWVYWKRHGQSLDWGYIAAEAEKMGMAAYERDMRQLCQAVFGDADGFSLMQLSAGEQEILARMMAAGTYGTLQQKVALRMQGEKKGAARWRYFKERLFPEKESLRARYPFFYEHKLLRPFLIFYRIYAGFRYNGKYLREEIRLLKKR